MSLSSLTLTAFGQRLASTGVFLRMGDFVVHVKTSIPSVIRGMHRLYSDFELIDFAEFADFHVSLNSPAGLRRWFKPQVVFKLDGSAPFKPLPLDQALPMLEWGLNWCVSSHANRYLIVHAAAVEKGGHAIILPAPPGSGKSTLCAALVHRGWRLLSDELTLIRIVDGRIAALPRPISLKNKSIDVISKYVLGSILSPTVNDTMKGSVALLKPPSDSVQRSTELAKPRWVVFPKWVDGQKAQLISMPRSRSFLKVAENAFNFNLLGENGFDTLAQVIDSSDCYEFSYSSLDDAIELFANLESSV